ncbi:DUF3883 domain-containing protein [Streptomyces sp. NPDC004728]|uniref:protein NO VEIN domain-containing protein n=1 Tax=Streptomyces sp. NPDC004728 TaxID=3154289 RepID=UPI0033A37425
MSMPSLPSEATRRAALRWLTELRGAGVPRLRTLFANHPAYADLTSAQYAEGLAWLRRTGMITAMGRPVVEVNGSELRDVGAASAVPSVQWSRATDEARRAIGAAGEKELLRLLRKSGVPQVRHVAAESDAYGYDIAAGCSAERVHLEVKSTTDPTRLVVHLTRHEYEVMATDADWHLVAVLVGRDGNAVNVATVGRAWLHSAVPADRDKAGRWESARLEVPAYAITPGLATETRRLVPDGLLPRKPVWAFGSSTSLTV